ncbi:SgcJ/EcaC family oxidoreductase [Reyranella soli]|uniref:SnoaL-like domain-containing protein n=1 Tax=Reyranella soli TaxID=1230389 RepID=A0A512NEH5_9HYPH|nr:SgcJ/EcaC family oxidoreductase [Reyranella soli]GEP57355.1 hypothetical protein RSO01_45210 [Reyranella soli]
MRKLQLLLVVMLAVLTAAPVIAGPLEDANAVVDRWATTFSTNDPDELTKIYWPDASLLGTTSPVMSEGTEGILKYFSPLKGSGFKCVIGERRTVALGDGVLLVAGFYEFSRLQDGKPVVTPARFTMLIVRRDGVWRIAHHHSSPHVQPKN